MCFACYTDAHNSVGNFYGEWQISLACGYKSEKNCQLRTTRTKELARGINNGYGVLDEMIIYQKYLTEVVDKKVTWYSK